MLSELEKCISHYLVPYFHLFAFKNSYNNRSFCGLKAYDASSLDIIGVCYMQISLKKIPYYIARFGSYFDYYTVFSAVYPFDITFSIGIVTLPGEG